MNNQGTYIVYTLKFVFKGTLYASVMISCNHYWNIVSQCIFTHFVSNGMPTFKLAVYSW